MSYKIVASDHFSRELKRLAKKYPSIKKDIALLGEELSKKPFQGSPLGKNCYKVRMAIASKSQGKSGGARTARRSGNYLCKNRQ